MQCQLFFAITACLLLTVACSERVRRGADYPSSDDLVAIPEVYDGGDISLAELIQTANTLSKLRARASGAIGTMRKRKAGMWMWTPQGFSTMGKDDKDGGSRESSGKIMRYGR